MSSTRGRGPTTDSQFPQADSLGRVLDVIAASCSGPRVDEEELGRIFGITARQGFYYANAAVWLGMTYKIGGWIRPTGLGCRINGMDDEADRLGCLAEAVVGKPVFAEAARHLAAFGELPDLAAVTSWVRAEDNKVNDQTAQRRAQTVVSWIGKIHEQSPEVIEALAPARAARFA